MKLTIANLTKTFVRADERIELFHDFSLTLNAGEALSVLGPSGSGKTTLLRMIAGLEPPDDGEVLFDGQDIFRMPPEERRAFRLRHIGFGAAQPCAGCGRGLLSARSADCHLCRPSAAVD